MSKSFIILLMVFCHIVDDFHLQGILANMKQSEWWKQYDHRFYGMDYLMALNMHAFSWAFMVMLPVAAYMRFHPSLLFYIVFTANWALHSAIDNLKANLHILNLIEDQLLHLFQIVLTAVLLLR